MAISKDIVKVAQHASGLNKTDIDGIVGPKTIAAAREYDTEFDDFNVPLNKEHKLIIYVAQHACGMRGSDLDGVVGRITNAAVADYIEKNNIRSAKNALRLPILLLKRKEIFSISLSIN